MKKKKKKSREEEKEKEEIEEEKDEEEKTKENDCDKSVPTGVPRKKKAIYPFLEIPTSNMFHSSWKFAPNRMGWDSVDDG